jgi:ADP-ribose pyrophosphatase
VIILVNSKREICFIKSPRYITQSVEMELPSGGIMPGEAFVDAATREVLEETGYVMSEGKHVYSFYPSNAISDSLAHIVFGRIVDSEVQAKFDTDEVSEVLWVEDSKVREYILKQNIRDGFALTALLYYYSFLVEE